MRKKRILHITSSLQMGGAEQTLFHIIRLLKDDFDHHVITFHGGPFIEKIRVLGVPVYQARGILHRYDPIFLIRMVRLIKKLNPELIHSLLWFANVWARILGRFCSIPVICAIHSPLNTNTGFSLFRSLVDLLTASWATKNVVVSRQIQNQNKFYLPAQKTVVIENGVDYQWLNERAQERVIKKDPHHFIIGTVGRLASVKNQRLLLQLIARLNKIFPQVRLVIIGYGELHDELIQQAHELEIEDKITIIFGEATFYYSLFDIFILPSFTEGLSIALLEAMSFAKPVLVAHNQKEHDIIVDNSNGYLFRPDDIDLLEKRVISLINDKKLRFRLAKEAFITIKSNFSVIEMTKKYRKLYEGTALKEGFFE